jgi:hypothetical protein
LTRLLDILVNGQGVKHLIPLITRQPYVERSAGAGTVVFRDLDGRRLADHLVIVVCCPTGRTTNYMLLSAVQLKAFRGRVNARSAGVRSRRRRTVTRQAAGGRKIDVVAVVRRFSSRGYLAFVCWKGWRTSAEQLVRSDYL